MYGSSYFDLKAELLRKEDEIKSKGRAVDKPTAKNSSKTFEKIKAAASSKKKKKQKKDTPCEGDNEKEIDSESLVLYEQAKTKLEAKTKIYDKMQNGEMEDFENIYGETKYLVDFEQKVNERMTTDKVIEPAPSIFEANEEHREQMRAKWEKEQEELLDGPIHYENLKFDEIRDLGTGYYAFSKNEEERKKQMEDLKNMRNQTLNMQNKIDNIKNKRKMALQERLDKIKQRKKNESTNPMDDLNKFFDEASSSGSNTKLDIIDETNKTADEIENDKSQTLNDMLQTCRNNPLKEREWDKGKRGPFIEQKFVPSRKKTLNSFEKIVEEKRSERPDEFAPPNFY